MPRSAAGDGPTSSLTIMLSYYGGRFARVDDASSTCDVGCRGPRRKVKSTFLLVTRGPISVVVVFGVAVYRTFVSALSRFSSCELLLLPLGGRRKSRNGEGLGEFNVKFES